MAPDDLHTVFGGVLGKHFINILGEVGRQLDMGEEKFLQVKKRCSTQYASVLKGVEYCLTEKVNPFVLSDLRHQLSEAVFPFSAADGYSPPRNIPVL